MELIAKLDKKIVICSTYINKIALYLYFVLL